ncbi:MAG: sodium-independent anion transporter, partial [Petrimonas sp.]|nr:sodium-independent anion transporter [Petrimonas sp.]
RAQIRIIRMRKVPFIDATGLNNLQNLCKNSRREKIQVILSGVNDNVRAKVENSKIPDIIGEENICSNIHLAVDRAIVLSEKMGEERHRKHKLF